MLASIWTSSPSGPVFTKGPAPPHRRFPCGKSASHYSPGQLHDRGALGLSPTAHLAKPSVEYLPDPLDIGSFEISSILLLPPAFVEWILLGPKHALGLVLLLACFSDNPGVVCRQDALQGTVCCEGKCGKRLEQGTLWGKVGQGRGSAPLSHTAPWPCSR